MAVLYNEYTSAKELDEEDKIPKKKKEKYKNYCLIWTRYLLGILPLVLPVLLALCSNIKEMEEESGEPGFDAKAITANMTALQSQVAASNQIIMQLQSQILALAPPTTPAP